MRLRIPRREAQAGAGGWQAHLARSNRSQEVQEAINLQPVPSAAPAEGLQKLTEENQKLKEQIASLEQARQAANANIFPQSLQKGGGAGSAASWAGAPPISSRGKFQGLNPGGGCIPLFNVFNH